MNGFYIFTVIMSLIFKILGGLFRLISTVFSVAQVGISNAFRRGVKHRFGSETEAEMLSSVSWSTNVLITGGSARLPYRNRLIFQLADQLQRSGTPVVILHQRNAELERLMAAQPSAVVCNQGNPCYDPFRDQDPKTIAQWLLSNPAVKKAHHLTAHSESYARGLAMFYQDCLKKTASLNGLLKATDVSDKGYSQIIALLQSRLSANAITQTQHDAILSLLKAGQQEELALNNYLGHLCTQLSSCIPSPASGGMTDRKYTSIYRTALSQGILCLDVSSVTDEELSYSLILSEFANPNLGDVYVILDNIPVSESQTLQKWLRKSGFHFCLAGENIYSLTDDGKQDHPLFGSLADECGVHIHFNQPSACASLLSAYYSTVEMVEIDHAIGQGGVVHFSKADKKIWQPGDFKKLSALQTIVIERTPTNTFCRETKLTP